ncbi:MAG: hypothetical protein F6K45_20595 [Kamptonema sp. SIO1D9]|nr:hypothetical protein [Kamptonema sp. SIO1D9]
MDTNEQKQKRKTSKEQEKCIPEHQPTGMGEASGESETVRDDKIRHCGETGEQHPPRIAKTLSGGIILQLIRQTRDQLEEAKECITWYEDQKQKLEKYLGDLEELWQTEHKFQEQTEEE